MAGYRKKALWVAQARLVAWFFCSYIKSARHETARFLALLTEMEGQDAKITENKLGRSDLLRDNARFARQADI